MVKYKSKEVLKYMKIYGLASYVISFSPEAHLSSNNGKIYEWYENLKSIPEKLLEKDEEVRKNIRAAISNLEQTLKIKKGLKE